MKFHVDDVVVNLVYFHFILDILNVKLLYLKGLNSGWPNRKNRTLAKMLV